MMELSITRNEYVMTFFEIFPQHLPGTIHKNNTKFRFTTLNKFPNMKPSE